MHNEFLDGLINEKDAAEFLGFTVRALQNWRHRGGGPAYIQTSPRSIRYRRRELIAWADNRQVTSTSDSGQRISSS